MTIEYVEIEERLKKFLLSDQRNAWLWLGSLELYLRKGNISFGEPSRRLATLDLANMSNSNPGEGMLRQVHICILTLLSQEKYRRDIKVLVFENVMNERLCKSLPHWGYFALPLNTYSLSKAPTFVRVLPPLGEPIHHETEVLGK